MDSDIILFDREEKKVTQTSFTDDKASILRRYPGAYRREVQRVMDIHNWAIIHEMGHLVGLHHQFD